MRFSSIGLGTWMMEENPKASITALLRGIECGANHIDTAEMYGDGKAEEIVGRAIHGIRNKIYLVSKVLPSNAGYESTIEACHRSLKRLKTDYLDVYLLHWRESKTPLAETFRAFDKLKEQGKINAWGVSNFDEKDMEDSIKIVGDGKIACNQVLYSMKERAVEFKLLPWCRNHNIGVVAYSPLGQGQMPSNPTLTTIAKSHHVSPAQVLLSFLTRDPLIFAIPKSSDPKRTEDNVRSMNLKLTQEDMKSLDKAFPAKSRRSLPMI